MIRIVNLLELSQNEQVRYSRQLVLPEVGQEGQGKLKSGRVLVVGAGGLGSPALLYLAAAGVGTIGVAEYDVVELSNLQRQILYCMRELGLPKVEAAARRLAALNDEVVIQPLAEKVSAANVMGLVDKYDIVLDGTDNIPTRYLLNDACVRLKKPYIYGAVYRWEGIASVLACPDAPCYCCLYPEGPLPDAIPNPALAGVLGVAAGTIGTIQATEAIKLILTGESSLVGRLLVYDAMHMRFEMLNLQRNQHCLSCGL